MTHNTNTNTNKDVVFFPISMRLNRLIMLSWKLTTDMPSMWTDEMGENGKNEKNLKPQLKKKKWN